VGRACDRQERKAANGWMKNITEGRVDTASTVPTRAVPEGKATLIPPQ
jgi:hypothetical protein